MPCCAVPYRTVVNQPFEFDPSPAADIALNNKAVEENRQTFTASTSVSVYLGAIMHKAKTKWQVSVSEPSDGRLKHHSLCYTYSFHIQSIFFSSFSLFTYQSIQKIYIPSVCLYWVCKIHTCPRQHYKKRIVKRRRRRRRTGEMKMALRYTIYTCIFVISWDIFPLSNEFICRRKATGQKKI